jgi:hypothetical protein
VKQEEEAPPVEEYITEEELQQYFDYFGVDNIDELEQKLQELGYFEEDAQQQMAVFDQNKQYSEGNGKNVRFGIFKSKPRSFRKNNSPRQVSSFLTHRN